MSTPILVGVGQYTDRIEDPAYRALSVVELGAEAARRALNDALGVEQLAPHIDVVVPACASSRPPPQPPWRCSGARTSSRVRSGSGWAISRPGQSSRFGGGQSPQELVNEFAEAIAAGEAQLLPLR